MHRILDDKLIPEFVLEPTQPISCSEKSNLFFLVLVHSKPNHFERRQIIRETWGSVAEIEGRKIKVVFLIGNSSSSDSAMTSRSSSFTNWVKNNNHRKSIQEPKSMNWEEQYNARNTFDGINSSKEYHKYWAVRSNIGFQKSKRLGKERKELHQNILKANKETLKMEDEIALPKIKMASQNYSELQKEILEEHKRFDDMIQGNFTDNLENSVKKHLAGFTVCLIYHCFYHYNRSRLF